MSIKLADIKQKKRIGEILTEKAMIEPDELKTALNFQKDSGEKVGKILVELGYISEKDLLQELSLQLEIPLMTPEMVPPVPVIENTFSLNFLKYNRFLPIHFDNGLLSIACVYPNDYALVNTIRQLTQHEIKTYLAPEVEILDLIDRLYGAASSDMERIIEGIGEDGMEGLEDVEDIEHLKDLASEAPVIRLVNLFLQKAVESQASDIHIEPFEKEFKVRYRIDGILHDIESPPKNLKAAIISRIKIMAKLNIAERRLPQDGRIKLRVLGKEIDLRVSTLPTLYGESVVLRILDKGSTQSFDLAKLGFLPDTLDEINKLILRPYGMFLVTGPTGSGKTTTLYGALRQINLPDKKIITIEDPVEYQIDGRQPDPRQPPDRAHLRQRPAAHRPPGPRRDHGRRDPRPGDGRDRHPGGPDRPPGLLHPAHQRRPRRHHPPDRHGRGGLPAGLVHPGRPGPAPGAGHLRAVPGAGPARAGHPQAIRLPARHAVLPGQGLPRLRQHRLPRPHRHLRADAHDRRDQAPDHQQRPVLADPQAGRRARACAPSRRTASSRCARAGPPWPKCSASPRTFDLQDEAIMTAFAYKAANREGKIVEGQIEAETERAVLIKLQDLGYMPLRITAGRTGPVHLLRPAQAGGAEQEDREPRTCCSSPRS